MPTTGECALFSDNAYGKPGGTLAHNLQNSWRKMPLPVKSNALDNPHTGFRAHVYQNEIRKEIVIVFAETHRLDLGDLDACWDIWRGRLPQQFFNARALYNEVATHMIQKGIHAKVSFTGHSLGGALAQYMAIEQKGCPAVSFSGPGVLHALGELRPKYDPGYSYPVVNHVAMGDEFANFGRHVGQVYYHGFERAGGIQAENRMPDPVDDYELVRRLCLSLFNHSINQQMKEWQKLERSSYRGKVTTTHRNGVTYREVEDLNLTGMVRRKIRVPR
jgi:hypothetical protein